MTNFQIFKKVCAPGWDDTTGHYATSGTGQACPNCGEYHQSSACNNRLDGVATGYCNICGSHEILSLGLCVDCYEKHEIKDSL